jgi:hypothetical protein
MTGFIQLFRVTEVIEKMQRKYSDCSSVLPHSTGLVNVGIGFDTKTSHLSVSAAVLTD